MMYQIIAIRDHTEYLEKAIDYFAMKWGIDRRIYEDCMQNSIHTTSPLPRWFLLLDGEAIIGCYGLITNDFISRQDLYPWLCALYIEEEYRGNELGAMLLKHGQEQANKLGYQKLFLCTGHVGYYEKYGFVYIGDGFHPWGESSRIYEISTNDDSSLVYKA